MYKSFATVIVVSFVDLSETGSAQFLEKQKQNVSLKEPLCSGLFNGKSWIFLLSA